MDPGPQVQPTAPSPALACLWLGLGVLRESGGPRWGGRGAGQLACVPTLGPGPSRRGGGLATQALAGAGFLAGLQGPPSCFLSRGLSWQRPPSHFLAGTGPAAKEQPQRESKREMGGNSVCVCVRACVCARVCFKGKKKKKEPTVQSSQTQPGRLASRPFVIAPSPWPPPRGRPLLPPSRPPSLPPSFPRSRRGSNYALGIKRGAESGLGHFSPRWRV